MYALANAELTEQPNSNSSWNGCRISELRSLHLSISWPHRWKSEISRCFVGNALDRNEVRVVVQAGRALMFGSKGKPSSAPVEGWNIRSLSYGFRVRPVTAHPEKLLVQPKDGDFRLPAGRDVLALNNQVMISRSGAG